MDVWVWVLEFIFKPSVTIEICLKEKQINTDSGIMARLPSWFSLFHFGGGLGESISMLTLLQVLDQSILSFFYADCQYFVVAVFPRAAKILYMSDPEKKQTGDVHLIQVVLTHNCVYVCIPKYEMLMPNHRYFYIFRSEVTGDGHEPWVESLKVVSCQETTACVKARQINHPFAGWVKSSRDKPPKF